MKWLQNVIYIMKFYQKNYHNIEKTYIIKVEGEVKESQLACVRAGVVIDGIGSEKIRSYTVANPMAFREYVDSLFPPTDEPTSRYKLRCALWLSYIGVRKTDILNVKESDIDLLSLSVKYNGDLLEIYRESIEPFRKMLSSDCYLLTGHHGYTTHTKKTEGDTLIRDVSRRSSGTTIESLTSDISRAATVANRNGITSKRLSLNDAWLSGMFYRQYERERAGVTSILREITASSMEVEKWRNNPSTFNIETDNSKIIFKLDTALHVIISNSSL